MAQSTADNVHGNSSGSGSNKIASTRNSSSSLATRQPAAQSGGKRGASGSSSKSIYTHPAPLFYGQGGWQLHSESLHLIYALAWTLSAAAKALIIGNGAAATTQARRNRIKREDHSSYYLDRRLQGVWDERTRSVWVIPVEGFDGEDKPGEGAYPAETTTSKVNPAEILWRRGFFGKGSLSRSEPTWFQREKNRVTDAHVLTAEDITKQRRADRKLVKVQKAKERADEREKLASAMLAEARSDGAAQYRESHPEDSSTTTPRETFKGEALVQDIARTLGEQASLSSCKGDQADSVAAGDERPVLTEQQDVGFPASSSSQGKPLVSTASEPARGNRKGKQGVTPAEQERVMRDNGIHVANLEHTQLQREEAFFLALSFDSLQVCIPNDDDPSGDGYIALSTLDLWELFLRASLPRYSPFASASVSKLRPDNPFVLSYVVYHHYRSLGWVVRNGVKFCVDWVLYKGSDGTDNMRGGAGPVGGHAEFSIVIVPTYTDPSDAPSQAVLHHKRDWRWLNTVNRVNGGVKKTVVLAFVTIPAMSKMHYSASGDVREMLTPECLTRYTIKEVSIRRFIPTRMRD